MSTIITYDVPNKHKELKQEMFALGFKDTFPDGSGKLVYLPNTTLYSATKTPTQALDNLKSVCIKINTQLERCITTQLSSDWTGIYGEPFK